MRSIFSNFLDSLAADVEVLKSSDADQLPEPKAEIEPSQSLKVQQFPASEIEMTHRSTVIQLELCGEQNVLIVLLSF